MIRQTGPGIPRNQRTSGQAISNHLPHTFANVAFRYLYPSLRYSGKNRTGSKQPRNINKNGEDQRKKITASYHEDIVDLIVVKSLADSVTWSDENKAQQNDVQNGKGGRVEDLKQPGKCHRGGIACLNCPGLDLVWMMSSHSGKEKQT
jgi:hypothetical protein